ncbi:MAG: hypothetical protein AB7W59_31775 [Acidimicrobiia bacterium]
MIGGLLAALVFTLVPGSLALAAARRAPREMYERAGKQPALVVVVLALGMVVGLGVPVALWYAAFVHRHRHAPDVLHDPYLVRWARDTVALPRTLWALRDATRPTQSNTLRPAGPALPARVGEEAAAPC